MPLYKNLNNLDFLVFFALNALVFALVVFGRRVLTGDKPASAIVEYLLMGRRLTLPLFVATLVSTWYGGIFGVTQIAFENGIYALITQGLFWYVSYIIFAFFMAARVRQTEAKTLPELIANMYGSKAGYAAAIFNLFNVVPIVYAISIGLLLQGLLDVSLWQGSIYGTLFVCFYSLFGGFRAVILSDIVQFFVMCVAVFLVVYFSYVEFGGLAYLKQALPEHYFKLTGKESVSTLFVWGLIALSTLVDPNFYQRCFAAKNVRVAKFGILLSTLMWFCFDICTVFGSMYAAAYAIDADSKSAYLDYALTILPIGGLRGFFIAGICATILSTLDSYIFIASNTISYDLMPSRLQNKRAVQIGSIFFVGILAVVLGQVFEGSIKTVWKTLGSLSAGCLLVPVVVGFINKQLIDESIFLISIFVSSVAIAYWRNVEHSGFMQSIDDLYVGVVLSLTSIFVVNFYRWSIKYFKVL